MKRLAFFSLALSVLAASTLACSSAESGEEEVEEGALEDDNSPKALTVPFYFSVPKDALADISKPANVPIAWQRSRESAELGLRIIPIKEAGAAARKKMAETLPGAGLLKTGDVVLTFRPNLADTIPYAHIQMGTTHAGVIRVENGVAHSVDQPLDTEHNSPGQSFAAPHYMGTRALHILRPRNLDAQHATNLDGWLERAEALIGKDGRAGFNSNYLAPAAAHPVFGGNVAKLTQTIGAGLLGGNLRAKLPDMDPAAAGEQQLFCSELAYHLLALSNCSELDVQAGDMSCAQQGAPFPLMGIAGDSSASGLGEGPLLSLLAAKSALGNQAGDFIKKVFTPVNEQSSALSSGHRKANEQLSAKGAVTGLQMLYQLRAQQPNAPLPAQLQPLKEGIPANYSPTAFLINSLMGAQRNFDYVATVVFLDDGDLAVANELAQQEVPHVR